MGIADGERKRSPLKTGKHHYHQIQLSCFQQRWNRIYPLQNLYTIGSHASRTKRKKTVSRSFLLRSACTTSLIIWLFIILRYELFPAASTIKLILLLGLLFLFLGKLLFDGISQVYFFRFIGFGHSVPPAFNISKRVLRYDRVLLPFHCIRF